MVRVRLSPQVPCTHLRQASYPQMTSLPSSSSHMHGLVAFTGHRCLLIAEIFDQIVRHVYSSGSGEGSVASLAATCKSFHVPAICVLWEKMVSVAPLVETLPPNGIHGELEFPRRPSGRHKLYHDVRPLFFLNRYLKLTYSRPIEHIRRLATHKSCHHDPN